MKNLFFIALILLLFSNSLTAQINGVSYVSVKMKLDSSHVSPAITVGANWISLVSYAYMPSAQKPTLKFDEYWQWHGERLEGMKQIAHLMKEQGLLVMIKPQVRVEKYVYTGKIGMKNRRNWRKFEDNYSAYILAFAKIAEEENADLFCIGTEMKRFVKKRKRYWKKLISDVQEVYSGKLTYAANWDDYNKVPFWSRLDYIGIDAYFPIAKKDNPTISDLTTNWEPLVSDMEKVGKKHNKKIIFTEYGYRSIENCTAKPWDYETEGRYSELSQVNALKALYESVWNNDCFSGGFLWQWWPDHKNAGGTTNSLFTVQNKAGEKIVKEYYTK